MTPNDLSSLLLDFHREKLALRNRHVAGARLVSNYDFNNAYQYVIAREDVHVAWVRAALEDLAVEVPASVAELAVPSEGRGEAAARAVAGDDARTAREFVALWRPRVETMSNARHRKMLQVVLGEMLEHLRFFEQVVEGREDLLGRRHANVGTGGGVMPVRWRE